jgi:tRNA threonylcarbamoyladenosine biosynthesis protein TsaB
MIQNDGGSLPPSVLSIDTATELCSVALLKAGTVFERRALDPQGHSRLVLEMIEEVLAEGEIDSSELDVVSYDAGPGSFTGIRIGAGVAQGLALGLQKPLLGVSSLMILAEGVNSENSESRPVMAAIDARMKQVYWGILAPSSDQVEGWRWIEEPTVSYPEKVSKSFFDSIGVGSGWDSYSRALSRGLEVPWIAGRFPAATAQAVLAKRILSSGRIANWQDSLPTYVRDTVVS